VFLSFIVDRQIDLRQFKILYMKKKKHLAMLMRYHENQCVCIVHRMLCQRIKNRYLRYILIAIHVSIIILIKVASVCLARGISGPFRRASKVKLEKRLVRSSSRVRTGEDEGGREKEGEIPRLK